MAVFKCAQCGAIKEGRCKPKKCPACNQTDSMIKQGEKAATGCGCGCKKKK